MKLLNAIAGAAAISGSVIAIRPAQAQHTCYTHRDESKPSYVDCDASFMNGEIVAIKDYSTGATFRAGKYGWIPAPGNCLRNLESGSKICVSR